MAPELHEGLAQHQQQHMLTCPRAVDIYRFAVPAELYSAETTVFQISVLLSKVLLTLCRLVRTEHLLTPCLWNRIGIHLLP